MDIKDVKAHYRAEKEEQDRLPWFMRILVTVGEFFRYSVWGWFSNFPQDLKCEWQRFYKGYADCDVRGLNDFIINKVRLPLKDFVLHEAEHGLSLPKEFETDPAMWLEILQKIEFSIDDYWRSQNESDYYPTKNMGVDEVEDYRKRVDEGFVLFGKYLRSLWN